ncbi:MAG: ATP-binding protein [Acidobacteriota bacterium]
MNADGPAAGRDARPREGRGTVLARLMFGVAALLATLLVAALGVTSFERKVESFQPLGVELAEDAGGFRVTTVTLGGTGLEVDDVVVLARGDSPSDVAALADLLRERGETTLLVLRDGMLDSRTYLRPALAIDWPYLALALIGVLYLLIGLYTLLKDRRLEARLFFLWCLASAALFLLSPRAQPVDAVDTALYLADLLGRTLLPAITLHLFLLFPTPLVARPWSRLTALLYLPAGALLAFHADQIFARGEWLFGRADSARLLAIDRLELIFLVACSLIAAFTLAIRLVRRPGWEHKRQVQSMIAGLVGGYLPFLFFYLLPWNLGIALPTWSTLAAVVPLALVPVGFAWAILKYKLLDFGPILRDAIAYSAAALVGVFGFQIAHLAIRSGIAEDLPLARNLLTFGAGLALAGVLVPTKNAVAQGLEQWRLGGRLGPRRLLRGLGRELLLERDLERLCGMLLEQLEEAILVQADLYLAQRDGGFARVRRHDATSEAPGRLSAKAFDDDFWQLDVESISALGLPGDEPTEEQRLFRAGFRYAFPLQVRGQAVAIAVVGYKLDDAPLTSEDVDLLRGVLDQAALAIENAGLVDELRQHLAEVSHLEAYSQGILDSSPAGIAVLDAGDRVDSANRAFATLCRIDGRPVDDPEQLVGRAVADLLPVHPLPGVDLGPVDIGWCEADSTERYLQVSMARWAGPSESGSARVLVAIDVSDRMAMEHDLQEKERLASLGMLAAGVAHEVNTPLTGISSYAQFLMQDTDRSDPRYALLEKMERQTHRASQIVNNLLDFARNRRDAMSRVQLTPIVVDALTLLEERARGAGVLLSWRTPDVLHPVRGHEGELHQVVTNLVVNAIEATADRDERLVRVELDERDERVRLTVRDSGPGIPQERLDTVFKPFFSSKLGKGGSGLGLAITHNLVRRHGGTIGVTNNDDGDGCTFTVELPSDPPG